MKDIERDTPSSGSSDRQDEGDENALARPPLSASLATREMMQLRQELAATLLELSQDAIIIRDAHDRVTFWNRGAHEMYGWSADEALSKRINRLLGTAQGSWEELNKEIEATGFWDGELLQRRKNGTPVLVHCREVLVRDDAGNRSAVLAIKRDITEQRRAFETLKEADRSKDEFLATLAHELRNPLAPIRNAVEIMRLARSDRKAIDQARAVLDRQARQLARIVEDLIDLARIVEKKVEMRRERVEIRTIVETALETSRPQIEEGRLRLIVRLPDEPLFVDADPVRLSQVLVNLLNNAAKHTAPEGEITLAVERASASPCHGGTRPQDELIISVGDTGSGIAPTLLPHVFEMFTQGPRTTEQGRGGLGVGLALVRNLVQMHGGSVHAFSEGTGQGSEFVVRLPLADQPQVEASQPERETRGRVIQRRIIVVDDNDDNVQSLGMLLTMMGHTVHHAANGPEAIEKAAEFQPDLMLIDIGMPGMEGYEVARRIRERPGMDDVVLVAQTGWGGDADRRRSREAGFNAHLVKPLSLADLDDVLRTIPNP